MPVAVSRKTAQKKGASCRCISCAILDKQWMGEEVELELSARMALLFVPSGFTLLGPEAQKTAQNTWDCCFHCCAELQIAC